MQCSGPLHLPTRAYWELSSDKAIYIEWSAWDSAWVWETPSLLLCMSDNKPLVAIMGKDVATLSKCLQCIILCTHQYKVCILYKPSLKLFIAGWLSWHNHEENKDREISVLIINVNIFNTTVDLPMCTLIQDIHEATARGGCMKKKIWHRTYWNIVPSNMSWPW